MNRAFVASALFVSAFFAAIVAAHPQKPARITGTYSSMFFHEETGDVLGEEIKIVVAGRGYQGALQFAEGATSDLVIVDIKVEGTKISFSMPLTSEYPGQFSGAIVNGVIKGKFSFTNGASEDVELKKGKSYWD